jgi:hypothetical protein
MTGSVKTAVERATDGVVPELARDDLGRKKLLRVGGRTMGSGAAAAARGAFIAACGGSSSSLSAGVGATEGTSIGSASTSARSGSGVLAIANYALTLERVETYFDTQNGKSVGASGEARSLAAVLGNQTAQRVKALMSAIKAAGGTPVKKSSFAFPVSDQASFLKFACTLASDGAGAYNRAARSISSIAILKAAGSTAQQVEARHAAGIGLLVHPSVTPTGAFDAALTKTQLLATPDPLFKKG